MLLKTAALQAIIFIIYGGQIQRSSCDDCTSIMHYLGSGRFKSMITCYDIPKDMNIDYNYDTSLKDLIIRDSNIPVVPANNSLKIFNGITNLEMSAIGIREIEAKAFEGLSGLETLNLNRNEIEIITNESLSGLHLLKQLSVSENSVKSIHPGAFSELKNLETLYLNDNNISFLPRDLFAFNGLTLSYIDLSNNPLSVLPEFALLRKLTNLVIKSMKLQSFDVNMSNMTLLEINLSGNQLTSVNFTLFPNLTNFDISKNNLTTINGWQDFNCTNLNLKENKLKIIFENIGLLIENLDLSGNLQYNLPNSSKSLEKGLLSLKMEFNSIVNLEHYGFLGFSNLKSLSLASNNLTSITDDPFYNLVNLVTLDLHENQLQFLEESTFWNNTNLEELDLSFNALNYLQSELFYNLSKLHTLRFSDNRIVRFDFRDAVKHLISLQNLFVLHNKWICSDMHQVLDLMYNRNINLDYRYSSLFRKVQPECTYFSKNS